MSATKQPLKQIITMAVIATAQAATATFAIGRAKFAGVVESVKYVPVTAITGANTDTRKVSLINKGQAGAGTTEVAAIQYNSGVDSVAFDENTVTLSVTAANLNVAEGDILAFKSEKVGTGIADGGGLVIVTIARS